MALPMRSIANGSERMAGAAETLKQEIAAFLVLTPGPEEGYDELTDGKWHTEMPYAVAHRSAVKSVFRGTGTSKAASGLAISTTRRWER